ncbi:hypothetical protein Sru01_49450 [Sphaerisporangium rufum]|uniref:Tryptophan-rich sensory protein n=1 Tax=Sphaerisporangium rufum TaxID=1381558 RepID=A0A919V3D7_9ACTN|nr:hypothetical protein [Sphaerisporangium rufum]GII79963.1 hypothetical protein Sru01_49450 [Sphaerisporangium rufum]
MIRETRPDLTVADRRRIAAVLVAGAAQALLPLAGPLLGLRPEPEVAGRHPTVITPPGPAFAVWGPIYAACGAAGVVQALPGQRSSELHRRTGWPLAGSYASNALWALIVQSGRWTPTPLVLATGVGFSAVAHRRLQSFDPAGAQRLVPVGTGLLLGWTGVAAIVNAVSVATRVPPRSRPAVITAVSALLAGAGGLAGVVRTSRQGALPVAATAGWALGTVAATSPSRPARAAAGAGLLAVIGALAANLRKRRR